MATSIELNEAIKQFQEVKRSLEVQKSLPWNLAVDTLRKCIPIVKTSLETQAFLDEYFFRMIELLLKQTNKAESHERECIEKSCEIAIDIILRLLPNSCKYLKVLEKIFDSNCLYYCGYKNAWSGVQGYPMARFNAIKRFAENNGFLLLLQYLNESGCWPGAESLHHILSALYDSYAELNCIDATTMDAYIRYSMQIVLSLNDEQLKEGTKTMRSLVKVICAISSRFYEKHNLNKGLKSHYVFLLDHAVKMVSSSLFVVKLYGWELINDIIKEANLTRPTAESYQVQGAGTDVVNGIYKAVGFHNDACKYQKPARHGDPLLTIFRCSLEDKKKLWYISVADEHKPGTNNDIDYYQHKPSFEDQKEPPSRGWAPSKQGQFGRDPPPLLTRVGSQIPEGWTEDMYLYYKVPLWVRENGLLGKLFGESAHSEILSRSLKLMLFLAESGGLKDEDIHSIWKAATQKADSALVDEFFFVLVSLSPSLEERLYNVLINCAIDTLQQDEQGGLSKASQFAEKYSIDGLLSNLHSKASCVKLFELLWAIYKNSGFEALKNGIVIQELLSKCLKQIGGNQMALSSVKECTDALQVYITSTKVNEVAASRVIQTLQFLISSAQIGQAGIKQLDNESFSSVIIQEIQRFVKTNRSKSNSTKSSIKWYINQIRNRLLVIRQFYGICREVNITNEILDSLCSEFKESPQEMEEFFVFLQQGATQEGELEFMGNFSIFSHIFSNIICNDFVDWSDCGDDSFECFRVYFDLLNRTNTQKSETISNFIGLDTLWRIYLSVPTEIAQQRSIELLILSYNELARFQPDAFDVMTNKIFEFLNLENSKLQQSSEQSLTTISRCIELLVAVVKWKGSSAPSHAAKGCMSRETIAIKHRKLYVAFDHLTRKNTLKVDKLSEGVVYVDVHPMHTIADVKKKVTNHLGDSISRGAIDKSGKDIDDNVRLFQIRPYDNGKLRFSYQISIQWPRNEDLYREAVEDTLAGCDLNSVEMIKNEADFQCLLNLAENVKDVNISSKIWDLIMMLPSQSTMSAQIEKQLLVGNSVSWSQVISTNSLASATYKLQIIDSILLPAPEFQSADVISRAIQGRKAFVASDGVSCVLSFFSSNFTGPKAVTRSMYASCLHVIHFLLFGADNHIDVDRSEVQDLVLLIQGKSGIVVEKLLAIASDAAASEQSDVVHNALHTLTFLLKSPDIISQLITNPQSKTLLVTVLKSGLKKVREMASDFAIQVGKAQPIVFKWLLAELETIEFHDELCADIFRALNELLDVLSSVPGAIDYSELASLISIRLMEYPRTKTAVLGERYVLYGYLELLAKLIRINYKAVEATKLGSQLVDVIVSDFLFALPTDSNDKTPICDTAETKQIAFKVLLALISVSPSSFQSVLTLINTLSQSTALHIKDTWGLQILNDMRKIDITHSGLKNQGCTCYMNSLLQQLFMNVPFREAILKTPLLECHRTTLWHRSDEDLVNMDLMFELQDGSWRKGKVLNFDPSCSKHEVLYSQNNETAHFNIREGRYHQETGRVRIVPSDPCEPIKESEDHAYRVLEQLQRTFMFMKHSKRRYFDPRPFVEACKTLNMNFSVYQQNDAAEFYDQLLDRIEIATKGVHTKIDIWNEVILKRSIGAQTLYQKIPQDCDIYSSKKEECGHWQGSRIEPFYKLEFQIRGKEKIFDSLDEIVQNELMDGENKIECDICVQKKTTTRSACINKLPNLMVLHLKRFDLDFQTFETVKLNNRMEFPFDTRLNMFKYTKEGLEWEEKNRQKGNESAGQSSPKPSNIQYENELAEPDMTDYEYELQGVLVHSGVAQGGHYYSFSRDPENEEKWYKFDDEDVSAFHPDQIPTQCFGGPAHSNFTGVEEDRTSNALILFYKKTRLVDESLSPFENDIKSVNESFDSLLISDKNENVPGLKLVDGNEAFLREVNESNLEHALSCYLLDCEMHVFVRALISSLCTNTGSKSDSDAIALEWSKSEYPQLPRDTISFGIHFLLDVILHCRERAGIHLWINTLKDAFQTHPETAHKFIKTIVVNSINNNDTSNWIQEYLSRCLDANARYSFVQLVFHAVSTIAPLPADALDSYSKTTSKNLDFDNIGLLLWVLAKAVTDKVFSINGQFHIRAADELFVLIREFAGIPCMNQVMLKNHVICSIIYFAIPEQSPKAVKEVFLKNSRQPKFENFYLLVPSVMEALAAILGVPQIRKVPLIIEGTHWDNIELVPEAKEAFSIIYNEYTENSRVGGMDVHDIVSYKEKTNGPKITIQQARLIIDKFQPQDGRLGLSGFLNYYADLASINQRDVWRDLHAFGFKNDLTRSSTTNLQDPSSVVLPDLQLCSDTCRESLTTYALYDVGLQQAEAATKAILTRVCYNEIKESTHLLVQALFQLFQHSKSEHHIYYDQQVDQPVFHTIVEIIKHMINIDDGIVQHRISTILFQDKIGLLQVYYTERAQPTKCRANDYDSYALYKKYVEWLRQFCTIPRFYEYIELRAETDDFVREVKRNNKLRPGMDFSENDEILMRETVVVVTGAGVPEVNGEYSFRCTIYGAGCFQKIGTYMGQPANFTIYKWKMKNKDHHWFISKTPEGKEPGTEDIDFYSVLFDVRSRDPLFPPKKWDVKGEQNSPAPTVTLKYPEFHRVEDYTSDSSDSDLERSNTSSEIQDTSNYYSQYGYDYSQGGY